MLHACHFTCCSCPVLSDLANSDGKGNEKDKDVLRKATASVPSDVSRIDISFVCQGAFFFYQQYSSACHVILVDKFDLHCRLVLKYFFQVETNRELWLFYQPMLQSFLAVRKLSTSIYIVVQYNKKLRNFEMVKY